ncbi:CDP-alcohol phosphatidyltransferase family protein [Candidatus Babeliales bacterium]|nr:CDP-alcohol phosphatidyltransferase family protein [Candidatus Babeliales bacterium]
MNLACSVTIARIVLVPFIIILLLGQYWYYAAMLFVVASLTDLVDGWIARRFNQQTALGQILDPIADKLLIAGTLYTLLGLLSLQPWYRYVMLFLIAKEFILLLGGAVLWFRYHLFIQPSRLSRGASICEIALILALFLNFMMYPISELISLLLIVNLGLSFWLLARYARVVKNLFM